MVYRESYYSPQYVFVLTTSVLPCNGRLSMWEFWVKRPGRFRAVVFRPDAGNPNRFTIVGINNITVSFDMTNQKVSYTVPIDDVIVVERGDLIGLVTLEEGMNPQLVVDHNRPGENIVIRWVKVLKKNSLFAISNVITTRLHSTKFFTSLAARVRVLLG